MSLLETLGQDQEVGWTKLSPRHLYKEAAAAGCFGKETSTRRSLGELCSHSQERKKQASEREMAKQGVASMFAMALLLGVFASVQLQTAEAIGVCYGMSANNLPAPSTVISMYKQYGISSMRLYAPDQGALQAVGGTGISVVVGAPNDVLSNLAASPAAAASWVRSNIQAYPSVSFRYISVGNEVAGGATANLAPAMENVHAALAAAGLDHIKVTTSVSQAILGVYSPPSAAQFTGEAQGYMGPVLQFLARTGAPLMANIYPYLAWAYNPSAMDMNYALFTAPGTVVQDGAYGYQNLFDTTVDAFYFAMASHGGSGVPLVVSESGWPSGGGVGANPSNARIYNQYLIDHVGRGTPRHPGAIETYLFSMFNENQKESGVEQNWGLFYPNMQRVYPISFN